MTQIVGVRYLLHNFKKISEQVSLGDDFIIMKNLEELCHIVPPKKKKQLGKKNTKHTLDRLKVLQFTSDDGDWSDKIDTIVYGT